MVFSGILRLMPRFKLLHCYIVKLIKPDKQFSYLTIKQFNNGFTLIELLIVISLFVLVSVVITASYLSFERSERLAAATQMLKSDIRYAQSRAISGDKGSGAQVCVAASTLVGWYVRVTPVAPGSTSYSIRGVCLTGTTEADFGIKTVSFPKGVSISGISYQGLSFALAETAILFRPISSNVTVHYARTPPNFLMGDAASNIWDEVSSTKGDLTITLSISGSSTTKRVMVKSSGEVNEI